MQTFLPYESFEHSVRCLDDKRLGNQVYNECAVLIQGKWSNHPASKMWRGYNSALAQYALAGLRELESRGRYYPVWFKFFESYLTDCQLPSWLGGPIHASHRSQLLRKDPIWYGQFGWSELPGSIPYFWPEALCTH